MVKNLQKEAIDELYISELVSANGKSLNYETLYSQFISRKYGVTPQYIRLLIGGNVGDSKHFTKRQV